jgi:DNA-binding FadR family transcriptional regulator
MSMTAQEITNALAMKIVLGDIAAHSHLPTIRQLSIDYGVSVPTAQRAVDRLSATGLIRAADGKQSVAIDFEKDATFDTLPYLFDLADRAPETAIRYFDDLLRLYLATLVDTLQDLLERRSQPILEMIKNMIAVWQRKYNDDPGNLVLFAKQEFSMFREICLNLGNIATVCLINTIERTLLSNDRIVAILYANPPETFLAWNAFIFAWENNIAAENVINAVKSSLGSMQQQHLKQFREEFGLSDGHK